MFGRIQSELGGVDVCINNAGLAHCAPLLSGSTADWKNMLDVNNIKPSNFLKAKNEKQYLYNSVFRMYKVQMILFYFWNFYESA